MVKVFRGTDAITVTSAGAVSGRSVVFQDRGIDRVQVLPDGTERVDVVGRSVPVNSIGRLVDVEGQTVSRAGRDLYDVATVCARLAP